MKILVVQLGFLGDVILSSALFENLKEIYPSSEIYILTTPEASSLFEFNSNIKEVLTYAKRKEDKGLFGLVRMVRRLRSLNFELVFSLHKSYRTSMLIYLSGIKKRYGFSESKLSFLYSETSPRKDLKHDVLRNLAIFRNIGYDPCKLKQNLNISLSKDSLQKADSLLSDFSQPFIGLAPGSVWKTKKWTEEGFGELSDLLSELGYKVVLIGGPADLTTAENICNISSSKPLNLVSKTSLIVSASLISKFKLLVSNDSAPLHLASALGVPVVSVFCATSPEFGFGPWKVPHRIVQEEELYCRPCSRHGLNYCPEQHFRCAKDIKAIRVKNACVSLLEEASKYSNGTSI